METDSTRTHTTTIGKANLFSLLIAFPVAATYITLYLLFWPIAPLEQSLDNLLIKLLPAPIIGMIIHELLHGITWAIFASKGWRSIKFGIKWALLTPYCHSKEPLRKPHYLLGTIMPLLVLGILPAIAGIATETPYLLIFGIMFTWAAAGDIKGVMMLRKGKHHEWVADHPDKLGFVVLDKK
mgnify:FL=1